MSDTGTQQEPSMEEILASIRRIIAEDETEDAAQEETPAEPEPVVQAVEMPEAETQGDDEILELTEVMAEAPAEADVEAVEEPEEEPPVAPQAEADDEIELTEPELEPEPEPEPEAEAFAEPEPPAQQVPAVAASEPEDEGLLSDDAADATAGALSALISREMRLGDGEKTLEDLAKEVLRPMLKAWLDENLPSLVEGLVQTEIDRLSRRYPR